MTAGGPAARVIDVDVDDRGSVLVVTILFFVLALLLVMGVSAASVAFVAQRNLASACDSAAVAAATGADLESAYATGVTDGLAVDASAARAVVAEYLATAYADSPTPVTSQVVAGGRTVTVECRTTVEVPFGSAFGYGDGLPRVAVATARMPTVG